MTFHVNNIINILILFCFYVKTCAGELTIHVEKS